MIWKRVFVHEFIIGVGFKNMSIARKSGKN